MLSRVRNSFLPQDLAVLIGSLAVGAALLLEGDGWVGFGVIVILCVLMMIPFYHHGSRIEGVRGIFRHKEILLPRECKDEIISFMRGDVASLDLHPIVAGGALVEVFYKKGDERMFARYFDYKDHSEGIEYPLYEVTTEQVAYLESLACDRKKS